MATEHADLVAADRLIKDDLQWAVQQALDDGYTHGQVTAAFIAQAYTILRMTSPQSRDERKAFFLELAGSLAEVVENASAGKS